MTAGTLLLVFRIARRELRGGIRGLRVFLACLVLGVTVIAGIDSLADSVVAGIKINARAMLGGDAEGFEVLRVQGQDAHNGLVLAVVLADVDLLALFAGAAGVHDEAHHCHPPP